MVNEARSKSERETPDELRELAAIYRGLAEVGAADQKNGRLRLASHLEELAEIREVAIRRVYGAKQVADDQAAVSPIDS